jgi:4-hydroxyphenylpyruvate dioxygenase
MKPENDFQESTMTHNPAGLDGIEFVEFASAEPERLHALFLAFGFSRTMRHAERDIDLYEQNDIHFLLHKSANGFAGAFAKAHGPSVPAMGWRVRDAKAALEATTSRGAQSAKGDFELARGEAMPAIYGVGESLIYFVDRRGPALYEKMGFVKLDQPDLVAPKGFLLIDHLTNNVRQGHDAAWAGFYEKVFGFTRGALLRHPRREDGPHLVRAALALRELLHPDQRGHEKKSQIDEYLDEYRGPGVQHLAFLTTTSSRASRASRAAPSRPRHRRRLLRERLRSRARGDRGPRGHPQRNVLVDGDDEGYLLQIFTKNLIGPIFIELIQRKNHLSFGEGNFGALFRSIERDQAKRGVFDCRGTQGATSSCARAASSRWRLRRRCSTTWSSSTTSRRRSRARRPRSSRARSKRHGTSVKRF